LAAAVRPDFADWVADGDDGSSFTSDAPARTSDSSRLMWSKRPKPGNPAFTVCARVVEIGSYLHSPKELGSSTTTIVMQNDLKTLRVYPGEFDPADPSHFTFEYEADGQRVVVDGYLQFDDAIAILPRTPAPTTTSQPSTVR
jgi:hypothetical protein